MQDLNSLLLLRGALHMLISEVPCLSIWLVAYAIFKGAVNTFVFLMFGTSACYLALGHVPCESP